MSTCPSCLFYFNSMTAYYFSTTSQPCLENRLDSPLLMNSKAILCFLISFNVFKLYLLYSIQTLLWRQNDWFLPSIFVLLVFCNIHGFHKDYWTFVRNTSVRQRDHITPMIEKEKGRQRLTWFYPTYFGCITLVPKSTA